MGRSDRITVRNYLIVIISFQSQIFTEDGSGKIILRLFSFWISRKTILRKERISEAIEEIIGN